MKKIDVFEIISRHMATFKDSRGSMPTQDAFVFFALPLFAGGILFWFKISFDDDVYGLTITVFSIFAALLLSVQVALFSIYVRPWKEPDDKIEREQLSNNLKERRKLLSELNINISYLIVISCVFVTLTLIFFVVPMSDVFETGTLVIFYTHFLMNLLMTVRRAFILFHKEYDVD